MVRAEIAMVMATKKMMASNYDNEDKDDYANEDYRDNYDGQDDSSYEVNDADDNLNNEDDGDNDDDKDSAVVVVGGFVSGGGNCGGIGCGRIGRWRVVVVVGLAVADGNGGTCSGCVPSGRCLKRLMGSRAMANDAMDVQGPGGGIGRTAVALPFFVFVNCVCGWVPPVKKNAISLSTVEAPKIYR
jgi:hypothetical protein